MKNSFFLEERVEENPVEYIKSSPRIIRGTTKTQ